MKKAKKSVDKNSPGSCLIVGIGASAGGLDAFKQFLAKLPEDFSFAIVFIQHLWQNKRVFSRVSPFKNTEYEINEISDGMETFRKDT